MNEVKHNILCLNVTGISFLRFRYRSFLHKKNPGKPKFSGVTDNKISAWRTEAHGGRPSGRTKMLFHRNLLILLDFLKFLLQLPPSINSKTGDEAALTTLMRKPDLRCRAIRLVYYTLLWHRCPSLSYCFRVRRGIEPSWDQRLHEEDW